MELLGLDKILFGGCKDYWGLWLSNSVKNTSGVRTKAAYFSFILMTEMDNFKGSFTLVLLEGQFLSRN